jgi:hypothetical protein
MKTVHPQSLAAMHDELKEALNELTIAESRYDYARHALQRAQARHGAASLASINALIELRKFIAENEVLKQAACERRSHDTSQGTIL